MTREELETKLNDLVDCQDRTLALHNIKAILEAFEELDKDLANCAYDAYGCVPPELKSKLDKSKN